MVLYDEHLNSIHSKNCRFNTLSFIEKLLKLYLASNISYCDKYLRSIRKTR